MLSLDSLDVRIFKYLKKGQVYPSALATLIGVGRTTLNYRLTRLLKLGYVNRYTSGRKSVYELNFNSNDSKKYVQVYTGKEIMSAYWKLASLPKETLILQVQGRDAANAALRKLPDYFIKKIHVAFKKKRMVIKCISNQESLNYFDTINKSLVESHLNRTFGVKIIVDKFLASGEIISTKNLLLLTNPEKERAVVIKDKSISEIVHDLLRLSFELLDASPTLNINEFLNKKLSK